jgi:hypothetical protein
MAFFMTTKQSNLPTLDGLFKNSETKERWNDTHIWIEKEERAEESLRMYINTLRKLNITLLDDLKVELNEQLEEIHSANRKEHQMMHVTSVMSVLTVISSLSVIFG